MAEPTNSDAATGMASPVEAGDGPEIGPSVDPESSPSAASDRFHEEARPVVVRIHTDHGSYIEPPLDQMWSDFQKLLWLSAVIEHDADLRLDVHETERGFTIMAAGFGSQYYPFVPAWRRMNALATGAEMYRAQHSQDGQS